MYTIKYRRKRETGYIHNVPETDLDLIVRNMRDNGYTVTVIRQKY